MIAHVPFQHILVFLEDDKADDHLLRYIERLVVSSKAKLLFVRVVQHPDPYVTAEALILTGEMMAGYYYDWSARERAIEYLRLVKDRFTQSAIPIQTAVLEGFSIVDTLVDFVKQQQTDVVIMQVAKPGIMRRILFGDITPRLIAQMPCPVLIVTDRNVTLSHATIGCPQPATIAASLK